jgi:hypothetical protein
MNMCTVAFVTTPDFFFILLRLSFLSSTEPIVVTEVLVILSRYFGTKCIYFVRFATATCSNAALQPHIFHHILSFNMAPLWLSRRNLKLNLLKSRQASLEKT